MLRLRGTDVVANILLLDDNSSLRTVMALALTRAGHHVLEAADGKAGIRLLEQNPIDVLVTDIVMPDQDGLATIPIARKLRPGLRIVVISGDSPSHAPLYLKTAGLLGAYKTLLKPFAIADLLNAVRESDPTTPPPNKSGAEPPANV